MEGSLFFQALAEARKIHKDGDKAPDMVYPLKMQDYLAQVTLCVKSCSLQMTIGIKALREFTARENSAYVLQMNLPIFADFFGFIY